MLGIDEEIKAELFRDCGLEDEVWIGDVYREREDGEVIPFQFGTYKYLMFFRSLLFESGNDADLLTQNLEAWANGFRPSDASRLVKFCRAEAEEETFKPDSWKLESPRQIFQFAETIGEVICLHSEICSEIEQFYYMPSSEQLDKLYQRIFKRLNSEVLHGSFVELKGIGDYFYGYQKISSQIHCA